ncbi:FMRFamide receptor-like [Lingula anatina]|uniref:FMRFamide receptor-like n=1 Tax=Lingula anatina TaxID=7574 RepID=A0A1S3HQ54_LINAN|nr:FMRFamide receptor-like [Lingula anatina]|eukprot:XP_013387671.1 FMRFamide receptor-like [Lingula anatina]
MDNNGSVIALTVQDNNASHVDNVTNDNCTSSVNYAATAFYMDTVVVGTLCVIGYVGNVLSFVVFWPERKKCTSFYLLLALAVADILYLTHCLLFQSFRSIYDYTGLFKEYKDAWPYMEPWEYPFGMMAQTLGLWFVVLVAVDRYIGVCWPFKAVSWCTNTRTCVMIVVTAIGAVLVNLPWFWRQRTVEQFDPCTREMEPVLVHYGIGETQLGRTLHTGTQIALAFLLPLAALFFFNLRLIVSLRQGSKRRDQLQKGFGSDAAASAEDTQITIMLVAVLVVYIVCELPVFTNHVLYATVGYLGVSHSHFNVACNMLATLNCSCNFFIYCVFRASFRRRIQHMCCASQYGDSCPSCETEPSNL